MNFSFTDDYKSEFKSYVDRLFKAPINESIKELKKEQKAFIKRISQTRNQETVDYLNESLKEVESSINDLYQEKVTISDRLIEDYFAIAEETPDSLQLDRLSTWIQKSAEHDNEEYDTKTNRQLQRIYKEREVLVDSNEIDDFLHNTDGNKKKGPKVDADSDGSHRVSVVLEYDRESDKRKYNAPVKKYSL